MKTMCKFISAVMLLFVTFAFGQEDRSVCDVPLSENASLLVKNSNFKKLVLLDKEFSERKLDKNVLRRINQEKESYVIESNFREISTGLGFSSEEEFLNYYENQKKLMFDLEKDGITRFTNEEIIAATTFILCENNTYPETTTKYNNCARKYRNCMLIAFATAIGGHVACGGADLTIIGGIICHGAVVTLQYAMQDNCGADFEDCK